MDRILNYLMIHKIQVGSVLFGVFLLIFVIKNWLMVKFWLLNLSYNFPFFGKIDTLSKDIEGFDENHKWFYSEERLCRDYYNFYEQVDKNGEL